MKKYRSITINVVGNGFIVNIGCQALVFQDYKKMLKRMADYYADPEAEEKKFFENHMTFGTGSPIPAYKGVGQDPRTATEQILSALQNPSDNIPGALRGL